MFLNLKSLILFTKMSAIKFVGFLSTAFLCVIGLSGCGGGGGSSDSNLPAVTIDSDNVTEIMRVTAPLALEMGGLDGLTDATELVGLGNIDSIATVRQVTPRSLVSVNERNIQIESETLPCSNSGYETISGSIADSGTLSKDDFIKIDADMCDNGGDEVMNGVLQVTISNLEGDISTSEFLLGFNAVFNEFTVIDSGESTVLNGDIGMTLDTRTASAMQISVFGGSFAVSSMGQTQSVSNFSNSYTVDSSGSPFTWIYSCRGTVSSSELTGTVSYQMPVDFEGSGENYPDKGELLVTGADNATLRLIVLDNINVQIDADYDGDGSVDDTFYRAWAELVE